MYKRLYKREEKRMRKLVILISFFVLTTYAFNIYVYAEDVPDSKEQPAVAASDDKSLAKDATGEDEDIDVEMEVTFVKDSIQPLNRAIFTFNDKLYYLFFKPLSNGYEVVVPEKARLGVRISLQMSERLVVLSTASFKVNLKVLERNCYVWLLIPPWG